MNRIQKGEISMYKKGYSKKYSSKGEESKESKRQQYYDEVANAFIKILETRENGDSGKWKQTWDNAGTPMNGGSKRGYHGCNYILLKLKMQAQGWTDPRFYTFEQIADVKHLLHKDEKWHLKKDSKGTLVEVWRPYDETDHHYLKKNEVMNPDHRYGVRSIYNYVYNGSCIDGLPAYVEPAPNPDAKPDDVIAKLSDGLGVPIYHDSDDSCYYVPSTDTIHLVKPTQFHSNDEYNATALHELVHSTGAKTRLNRDQSTVMFTEAYAYEELVAEIGSGMASCLLQTNGVSDKVLQNNQKYVKSWIKEISEKPESLHKAISEAKKASDYLANALVGQKVPAETADSE
jgi:antirestriction protein ArdC